MTARWRARNPERDDAYRMRRYFSGKKASGLNAFYRSRGEIWAARRARRSGGS